MRKNNFAFIDIETTGLDLVLHEIIEIGVVITTPDLKIIEEFELKIKPKHIKSANKVSLKINHYDKAPWKSAYSLSEAMKLFAQKTKDCLMVAQNVAFD